MDNKEIIYGLRYIIDRIYFDGSSCISTSQLSDSDLFMLAVLRSSINFIQENINKEHE